MQFYSEKVYLDIYQIRNTVIYIASKLKFIIQPFKEGFSSQWSVFVGSAVLCIVYCLSSTTHGWM